MGKHHLLFFLLSAAEQFLVYSAATPRTQQLTCTTDPAAGSTSPKLVFLWTWLERGLEPSTQSSPAVAAAEITQIIQVDLDLKYKTNIRDLFDEFDNFPEGAVIGIAREMQPVYRHTFWQYRRENPQTKVGDPPPDGLPGFNSGVLLLNLEAMRQSKLYNQLLEPTMVQKLTEKYHFKGHLGDQDFFTMVGMEHPELFHVLDCTWNRQLCTWWRDHGYSDVFDQYFQCEGEVKIYHGNCNTPIPED
ncbi:xyloside xylosyltransferase 1 isoform X3 [Strix aluco]|uniref:xyloside xylosyltransferase 1 isoform X3 n=1 Tax=Strix aluco TaxID=111821 RepID=UPI003DA2814C